MVVDLGVGKVLIGERAEVLESPVGGDLTGGNSIEQVGQRSFVHEGLDCILPSSQNPR
jgi:hypothetical protein